MSVKRATIAAAALLALTGCDETAALGGIGAPAAGAGSEAAIGDGAFVRDEQGCLYEVIAGAQVAIVGPDGRKDCGRSG